VSIELVLVDVNETPLPQFFAQARSLRLADGPDEVHIAALAKSMLRA
jgi:alkylation response protein AidB-like acyl-CoA dehydrogenase